ncbi:MAG: hypothetical protein HXY46_14345 [Syntrophaceae bacterium]|nr:hypothetical protein [Syntrophaceae bacterium]
MATIGDKYKNILTDKVYKVKNLKGIFVLLETEDGKTQVLTEQGNLNLFYEKVEEEDPPQDLPPSLMAHLQNHKNL